LNYQAALFIISLFIALTCIAFATLKLLYSLYYSILNKLLVENILEQSAFLLLSWFVDDPEKNYSPYFPMTQITANGFMC